MNFVRLVNIVNNMDFDLDKMYCGAIRRGDIFLAEFSGHEKPVVVLQDAILNERLETIVVVDILPHKVGDKIFKNEVLLRAHETGLGKDGICALHKVHTFTRGLMIAKKGELTKERLNDVYKAMDVNCGRFRD